MPQKGPRPAIWVPQPATQLYAVGGAQAESVRDRLVGQFGEATVQRAEVSVLLDLMLLHGVIKPGEFVDLMLKRLHRIDEQRRAAANLDEDRG